MSKRTLIAKKSGAEEALSAAVGGLSVQQPQVVSVGVFDCSAVDFIGIDPPEASAVNLVAPEPVDGEQEGWLYFRGVTWAAYTEDLVAIRITESE